MPRRCAAADAVRRSRPGANQPNASPRRRPPVRSPHRPCRRGVQLALRFRCRCASSLRRLTRPAWAPFRVRAPGPVSGRLSGTTSGRADHRVRFPSSFGVPAFASWVILLPPGTYAFLTVGLPGHLRCPGPDGVTTFHTHEPRPGRVPSRPRDGGAPTTDAESPVTACRFPAASPAPLHHNPSKGLNLTGIHEGSLAFTRPAFPSPVTPGWSGDPWAYPRSFAPRRYQRRTSGWGRALSTGPGLRNRQHAPALPSASPLATCDLVSHLGLIVGGWDPQVGQEPADLVAVGAQPVQQARRRRSPGPAPPARRAWHRGVGGAGRWRGPPRSGPAAPPGPRGPAARRRCRGPGRPPRTPSQTTRPAHPPTPARAHRRPRRAPGADAPHSACVALP